MIQGLTLATQGMTIMAQKQDEISNNLANINTTGYKSSGLFAKSFEKYMSNDKKEVFANREIKADNVFINYSQGPALKTSNDLDLMIQGTGFFTVQTPQGARFTRNGNFSIDSQGYLVTSDGNKVVGNTGAIRIDPKLGTVTVNKDGEVMQSNISRGTLMISDFVKPYNMSRDGSSLFKPLPDDAKPVASKGFAVMQGFLEGSNVSPVRSMVEMIATYRNFESDQKALQAQDSTLDKAVNVVAKM